MGGALLTTLSMDTNHLTILSMDSSLSAHDEMERELNTTMDLTLPPDINLPFSAEPSPPLLLWNDACDMLDVGLGPQHYEAETNINVKKIGKKCAKRLDSVWGAWFFFNFYFKPALNEKSKNKSEYDKSDLKLDVFLVQHDMENMYMWAFKERPENALGKMQLQSYMNGHSRQGERPFPFSADKGFVRSHRMQRKHYRGLSNPQCVHGIEVVRAPQFVGLDDEERKKWMELTGRNLKFSIPHDASDFGSWRNLQSTDFEIERLPIMKNNLANGNPHPQPKRLLNGSGLNLSTQLTDHVDGDEMDLLAICNNKRRKNSSPHSNDDESSNGVLDLHSVKPHWLSEFSGVMRSACGPVTGAKTIYEDEEGFLIVVSLPCADLQKVKVTWRNTLSHGIIKIYCVSTGCMPTKKRQNRTFTLTDPASEHCPPGEFIREIPLPTRIPDDAKLEAYGDERGTTLEIMVPKHPEGPEEHEPFEIQWMELVKRTKRIRSSSQFWLIQSKFVNCLQDKFECFSASRLGAHSDRGDNLEDRVQVKDVLVEMGSFDCGSWLKWKIIEEIVTVAPLEEVAEVVSMVVEVDEVFEFSLER
ncbi:hypothetical protein L6452_05549 [Arctium lappa]|uniref:Uncharacterized protein n=1 Tax=Arctium lappa TaxID=4217 RepID=A0ACB9EG53_ARCLA|nr:hypothetical protein L6452_05549 [Arctium lappa]